MSRASPRHTPSHAAASSSSSSSSVPGMNIGPSATPLQSLPAAPPTGRRLLRTPSHSSSSAAQTGATPLSAISALPSTTRTAEQLDRVKLDARLGNLLAFPMNQASEASSHFRADLDIIQGESQQELLQSLRMLEFEMEQDDWMYG